MSATLTAAQQAQTCPSCVADPKAAPGRYCASRACRCGHEACPAFPFYRPLERPFAYVELLHPATPRKPRRAKPSAWADREEGSTWIDSM